MNVENLLDAIASWARDDSRVRGLALVGSYARNDPRPDSDIDLVLLSDAPQELLSDSSWAAFFGEVTARRCEDYGAVKSLRVTYGDGPEVEFGLADVQWASLPLDAGTRRVLKDGAQVLYDDAGLLRQALESL